MTIAMESIVLHKPLPLSSLCLNSCLRFTKRRNCLCTTTTTSRRRSNSSVKAIEGAAADMAPVDISWQIAVGSLAGITPFIVAGIEFSKRIIAQKNCEICAGSGLVLKSDYYIRCPNCGGFLPWQSWKRFFKG